MSTSSITKDLTAEIISSFKLPKNAIAVESRSKAIAHLEKLGLPAGKQEEYRFAPITKSLEKNLSWSAQNFPSTLTSIAPYLIQGIDANVLVFVNGLYSSALSKVVSPETDLKIKTLAEAFQSEGAAIETYFDKLVNSSTDAFAALNTSHWQEGIFIQVPENVKVAKPVLVLHIHDASSSQVIAHTRVLAIVGKNSEFTLIEKFDTLGEQPVFHTFSEEIVLKENAQLEYCKVQNDQGNVYQVTNSCIHQSDSSKVNTFTLTLNGKLIRNNLGIIIDGEKCESHFHGLYLLTGNTVADNHTVVDHRKPNSFSNEIYKGVMDGNSKGIFNGKIFVRPHAQKTNAFQSNRNILVSETATINTKPQLEIWADDVKCSHGCTSGQLDEEALFYLRSRGISEKSAKAMLLYAFATDVLEPIKNENLKAFLDQLIAERLTKAV